MAQPVSQGGIDYPDGGFASGGAVFPMAGDLGELAVRLGSVVAFDRSGNVIFLDTFEKGSSRWWPNVSGEGAQVVISSFKVASPPYSLALTTGSDASHAAKTTLKLPYPYLSRMGLEYSFTHTPDSLYHYFEFLHRDGSKRRLYRILFRLQEGELDLDVLDEGWVNFASGIVLTSDDNLFNQGKLVVDLTENKYVRFTFNNLTWLLDDYAAPEYDEDSVPYIEVSVQFTGDLGATRIHYLDNVIVTQNEPLR